MNMVANILEILENQIQQHIKIIIHHNQVKFIPGLQGWFNIHKSNNVMHHKIKEKNHMVLSRDAEKKHLTKYSNFLNKNPQQSCNRRNILNIIKAIYEKPRANIILNGEKLKAFPLISGTRQGFPPSPLFFNTVLESPASTVRQQNETKGIQIV